MPTDALPEIAEREGWPLDLTDGSELDVRTFPQHLDRYLNETMAAHAAVVLAKTQAAAARAEARDLAIRLQSVADELATARTEVDELRRDLAESERARAILERDQAVAEARVEEVRAQIDQERLERTVLANRLGELETDHDDALASMDWISRRRFENRRPIST